MFSDKPFQFPPDLYNHLVATRWDHWGVDVPLRTDYPVHEVILMWQENILDQLLSPFTLQRLHDSELKVPDDKDAFTTAELITRLTKVDFLGTRHGCKGANTPIASRPSAVCDAICSGNT